MVPGSLQAVPQKTARENPIPRKRNLPGILPLCILLDRTRMATSFPGAESRLRTASCRAQDRPFPLFDALSCPGVVEKDVDFQPGGISGFLNREKKSGGKTLRSRAREKTAALWAANKVKSSCKVCRRYEK